VVDQPDPRSRLVPIVRAIEEVTEELAVLTKLPPEPSELGNLTRLELGLLNAKTKMLAGVVESLVQTYQGKQPAAGDTAAFWNGALKAIVGIKKVSPPLAN
jgi:hypothetical protein